METLNKNWFAFTLIAVIFGLLGFLIGKQGHKRACPMMNGPHQMMCMQEPVKMGKGHAMFMMKDLEGEGMEWIEDIDVEKETGEDGEKVVKVRVKAKKE